MRYLLILGIYLFLLWTWKKVTKFIRPIDEPDSDYVQGDPNIKRSTVDRSKIEDAKYEEIRK